MLLGNPGATLGGTWSHGLLDTVFRPVYYYGRRPSVDSPTPDPTNLAPLGVGSMPVGVGTLATRTGAETGGHTGADVEYTQPYIYESRYDIVGCHAAMTWEAYGDLINTLMDPANADYAVRKCWAQYYLSYRFRANPLADVTWGSNLGTNQQNFAEAMAKSVPLLLANCTNFKVEFAGDFVSQDAAGLVNVAYAGAFGVPNYANPQVDGVIDFNIHPVTGQRTIRWYGMCDTGIDPATLPDPRTTGSMPVAPVVYSRLGQALPFEESVPTTLNGGPYICAWSRRELDLSSAWMWVAPTLAPRLIRITVQIADPDGHVGDGMTQQFVFPVRFE
jgi:hypothetical protein